MIQVETIGYFSKRLFVSKAMGMDKLLAIPENAIPIILYCSSPQMAPRVWLWLYLSLESR
jgi:hypothetical protein